MWLDKHDYRTAVLLPSIEMSLNLLGDLRFYGADVGLLVGQSPETRINHAHKLAERLGADESRGFGRSVAGADLLGLTCALAAFDTDPEGHDEFPHLTPPCNQVLQRGLKKVGRPKQNESKHLCALSGVCGRMKAPRELAHRRIWLGHVLSMDTRISPHFADEQMRYFEAVAMTCDLVIVDEADGAQAALDRKAISSLDLTGSEESYEHHLVARSVLANGGWSKRHDRQQRAELQRCCVGLRQAESRPGQYAPGGSSPERRGGCGRPL
jgi:hypothetical protein